MRPLPVLVVRAVILALVLPAEVALAQQLTAPRPPYGVIVPPDDEAIIIKSVRQLLTRPRLVTPIVCVVYVAGDAQFEVSSSVLDALSDSVRVVQMPHCPPTFARMIGLSDSLAREWEKARPRDHVDPLQLLITLPVQWGGDRAQLTLTSWRGMTSQDHRCVTMASSNGPIVNCGSGLERVH